MTGDSSGVSVVSSSVSFSSVSGSVSTDVISDCAAIWWIFASANAPSETMLSSDQILAVTCITPSTIVHSVGVAPTLTESKTPSWASVSASSPALVAEIRAANITPSGVSTRSVTMPMGLVESWYCISFGAGPSTGKLPGIKSTSKPVLVFAATLYGAAKP